MRKKCEVRDRSYLKNEWLTKNPKKIMNEIFISVYDYYDLWSNQEVEKSHPYQVLAPQENKPMIP